MRLVQHVEGRSGELERSRHEPSDGQRLEDTERAFVTIWSRFCGAWSRGHVQERDGLTWFGTLRHLPYNGVIRTRVDALDEAVIDGVLADYWGRGVQRFWGLHTLSTPTGVAEALVARGLAKAEAMTCMALDLSGWSAPPPPPGVVIAEVEDETALQVDTDLTLGYWEIPPEDAALVAQLHRDYGPRPDFGVRYQARVDGEVVGKGFLCLDAGAPGIGAIYGMSVRREARGRGVAGALTATMQLRGFYIRDDIADFVKDRVDEIGTRLLCPTEDVEIEGKNSTGYYSRVPWVRFANRLLSPNPRTGWYATYLFAEDGSEVSLSLNQGTQVWDGVGMRSQPEALIRRRSEWARDHLAEALVERPHLYAAISLGTGDKSRAYEAGNVVAYRYSRGAVPDDDILASDLLDMADLLQLVYRAEAQTPAPGDPAPEIVEAERAAQEIAGRRVPRRTGFRTNAKQRRAVELRAMSMATEHFVSLGGTVTDVSAKKPFDLVVELDGVELTVEVKGTAGDGTEVLLTRGEVEHHQGVHPNNALAVVAGIRLQGPPDAPEAVGGVLRVISPWTLQMGALTPLSYRYAIDSPTAP